MYLNSTNNMSFYGHKEVFALLIDAATCSKAIARMDGSKYTISKDIYNTNNILLLKYLILAYNDDAFISTIKELTVQEINSLKKKLKSIKTARSGFIKPLEVFVKALAKVRKLDQNRNPKDLDTINSFLYSLNKKHNSLIST